jgi:pimeloyl-ACP methyl ester carboxylesterase
MNLDLVEVSEDTMAAPAFKRCMTPMGRAYVDQGQGEPLVLVHGVGMRLDAWAPQIEAFSRTHRVIAVDMPGHGESIPLPRGSDLSAYVRWLAEFLDELRLDRINLAGHSMGALIAGGVVATSPERIRRVALLNGVYRRTAAARAAVLARAALIETEGLDVEGPVLRWFPEGETHTELRALTRRWLTLMDLGAYAITYAAFAEGDATYADAWPLVYQPALFLTGADDSNSTLAMSEAMASLAPRGIVRVIQGHRHMVNLTAPERVNAVLRDWLAMPDDVS